MRYHAIENSLYIKNRANFVQHLKAKSVAVFNSNDFMPTNADGLMPFRQNNDLLYVPTAGELQQMQFAGTPAEQVTQAANYEAYIQQDDYLSENRGEYTERYGALAPWRGKWDVKLLQDYKFNAGNGKTNTIQISVDVLNVGNLLNSDWGIVQLPNNVSPVSVSVDQTTNTPTYSFNESNQETFGYNTSLLSRWQAQIGVRYIF